MDRGIESLPRESKTRVSRFEVLTFVVSLVALVTSGVSVFLSTNLTEAGMRRQVIHDQYETFDEFSKLAIDHWEAAHLNATPDQYPVVVEMVAEAFESADSEERARLKMKERGVALYIFTNYERSLFAYREAAAVDQEQAAFLELVLDYYTRRLLRNPRLLYFWRHQYLDQYFEESTREHYLVNVPNDLKADKVGPFGS